MLIDMHAHSSGISTCCQITAEEAIAAAREAGIDGIVLTNHYQKHYIKDGDAPAFARRYADEYERAAAYGAQLGFPVFFGIEVTMALHGNAHMLVYGVASDFVLRHPTMYEYPQDELYRLVLAEGGALVQAHPLRKNVNRLLDPILLDGVEISCHPLYEGTHLDELTAFAADHGLILTCGGDYHADTHRPHCGMYMPDTLTDGREIGAYLRRVDAVRLCVQEVDARDAHDVAFVRGAHMK